MPRRLPVWLLVVVLTVTSDRRAGSPRPPAPATPHPPPRPFHDPGTHAADVYVPPGYGPYVFFADDVGRRDPACWCWLGETVDGRVAWVGGVSSGSVHRVAAGYEARPGRWRVWFGSYPAPPPAALPPTADGVVRAYRRLSPGR